VCILPATQSYIRQYGKMEFGQEKAFSALAFHETKSVVTVQSEFRRMYGKSPQVNHQFVLGTSVLLSMASCVKGKAPADPL
jgi:hypothetical protein